MITAGRTGAKPGALLESLKIGAASFATTAALILFLGAGSSPIG